MLHKLHLLTLKAAQESRLPLGKAPLVLVVIWGPIVGVALIALVRVIAIISS
jgi:hypothetical protein